MKRRLFATALPTGILAVGLMAAIGSPAGAGVKPRAAQTLYVAPIKGRAALPGGCKTAKFSKINAAIKAASVGDTVKVCAGTYTGTASVKVKTPLGSLTITSVALIRARINLVGMKGAIINAKGADNAVTILFPGSAGTTVKGLTAEGAIGEGILAAGTSNIHITGNTVKHNDNGGAKSGWPFCVGQGPVPGDCGEGVQLLTVSHATIANNTIEFNSGGILLSDELGPTSHNTIVGNLVEDNESDCGITVVGHNAGGVNAKGVPQPKVAGVYGNLITANEVISNGTTGEGGGILFAGPASYDNTVTNNEIAGNGLAGVTIHEHGPAQALSGDVIKGNWIGTNDITGDPGTADSVTTGIFVERDSPKFPAVAITIKSNTIAWNVYGIFDNTGGGLTASGNIFVHVAVHVKH